MSRSNTDTFSLIKTKRLNKEQLRLLTTERLTNYKRKQRSLLGKYYYEGEPIWNYSDLKYLEQEYKSLLEHIYLINEELNTRKDAFNVQSKRFLKIIKKDESRKNKGSQSLKKSKRKSKNKK